MKKAILFWFYKEAEVCLNRLEIIKQYNPDLQIFGLYGWDKIHEQEYKNKLWKYLDDFYTIESEDTYRKWACGDLALQEWYNNQWNKLDRDSLYIVQRDILIFNSLNNIFDDYKRDQVFFSWTEILNKEIESKWSWTNSEGEIPKYLEFKKHIQDNFDYKSELLCCLPMFEILPRLFFEKYNKINNPELGFIEYRKPTYAKIFGFDFYKKDLWEWWFQDKTTHPMNGRAIEIKERYINKELEKRDWRRMFHPYYKKWKK